MATASVTYTADEMYTILETSKMAKLGLLPPVEDIDNPELNAIAQAYLDARVAHNANNGPFGLALNAIANEHADEIVGPIPRSVHTSHNAALVWNNFGWLFKGTGNPNRNFKIVSDGIIELGLQAGIVQGFNTPISEVDDKYTIAVPTGGDWNFTFSAGILGASGAKVTNLYDVEMLLSDGSAEVTMELSYDASADRYVWSSPLGPITDSGSDMGRTVVQNIQRFSFFSAFGTVGQAKAGTYTVELTATSKANGQVITNEITIVVTV